MPRACLRWSVLPPHVKACPPLLKAYGWQIFQTVAACTQRSHGHCRTCETVGSGHMCPIRRILRHNQCGRMRCCLPVARTIRRTTLTFGRACRQTRRFPRSHGDIPLLSQHFGQHARPLEGCCWLVKRGCSTDKIIVTVELMPNEEQDGLNGAGAAFVIDLRLGAKRQLRCNR